MGHAGVRQREGRAVGGASSPVPVTDLPAQPAQVCLHYGAGRPQVPQLLTVRSGHSLLPVSLIPSTHLLFLSHCLGTESLEASHPLFSCVLVGVILVNVCLHNLCLWHVLLLAWVCVCGRQVLLAAHVAWSHCI